VQIHSHVAEGSAHGITATRVPEAGRFEFLPRYFGRYMLAVERRIYLRMEDLAPDYSGGYWHFWELANGGCYLAPQGERFRIVQPNNGFDGTVSADAAGVIVTLYALSELSFRYSRESLFGHLFYRLRDFAAEHAENGKIFAAID
jgi:hypothetical protein